MDEVLRDLGARLFVYSPRQIDPDSGQVRGLLIENGRFVPVTAPVPTVNGSWYIGRDRSSQPSMNALQFRNWVAKNGIDIYPLQSFSKVLKDKLKTSRMIRDFDSALHPSTEAYNGDLEQLTRFVQRYRSTFVKPRFGSKGNDIFSIRRTKSGLRCTYYSNRQWQEIIHATPADALAAINQVVGKKRFVIQQGIAIERHNDAPYIFRVILLDDGKQWQWVHKAVLAAPGSNIANTTQGGSNWKIVDLLGEIYGENKATELFDELQRTSFDCIHHLDMLFPGKLMEVAFDFVLSKSQKLKILEINTLPGMTKPGLPPEPAFSDILNRQPHEQDIYDKYVLPHGSCLARFLYTRLEERQAQQAQPGAAPLNMHPFEASVDDSDFDPQEDDTIVDPVVPLLDQTIITQAGHLRRSCLANGSFRQPEKKSVKTGEDPRFDVLRHVEAIYSLDQYDQWRADTSTRETARRAGEFLKNNYIAPIPGEDQLLAVWSRSEFNQMGKPDQIKLGWVGLALIALLCLERQNPGFSSLEELRALGEFLRWGQNADGSFRSLFVPSQGGWKPDWSSLNYPGEAAFALLMLHELDPSPAWIEAAANGIGYLVRTREKETEIPADYWSLLATSRLLPVLGECKAGVSRENLMRHTRQVCESIMREQVRSSSNPLLDGGFDSDGRTEPTATLLQGLLAAQTFMQQEDPAFSDLLRSTIRDGINFLIRACISDNSKIEAMPRAIQPRRKRRARKSPTTRRNATRVRLDCVQHALSAMIQHAQLSESVTSKPGDPSA